MEPEIEIGKKIKHLRIDHEFSQSSLATKIGCSQKLVSLWETGQRIISIKHLLKVSKIFRKEMSYFIKMKRRYKAKKEAHPCLNGKIAKSS